MPKPKYDVWLTEEGRTKLTGWKRDGLSDEQIANNMGCHVSTLYKWRNEHKEIDDALKKGKEVSDYEVENALFKSAIGYFIEEEDTTDVQAKDGSITKTIRKHKRWIAPSTGAQAFWLKNKLPEKWRDRPEVVDNKALEKLDSILGAMKDRAIQAEQETE